MEDQGGNMLKIRNGTRHGKREQRVLFGARYGGEIDILKKDQK